MAEGAGRGAILEHARDVRRARADEDQDTRVGIVRKVDHAREVEHRAARQHVIQVTVAVIIREPTGESETVRTGDRGVITVQEDRVRERVGAGEVEAGLDDAAVEIELADRQGRNRRGGRCSRCRSGSDRDRTGRNADDGGTSRDARARNRLADLESDGRRDRLEDGGAVRGIRRSGRDAAGTEGADLVQQDAALGQGGRTSIGIGRSSAEGQRRVVGDCDVERRVAADAGITADDAVPNGRAGAADGEGRRLRSGRGGGVHVIPRDGEDLAVLEVVRERGSVIARALGDIASDRNVILAGNDERGVIGP